MLETNRIWMWMSDGSVETFVLNKTKDDREMVKS